MIKFKDGKIDPRPVVDIVYTGSLSKAAVVADHEGFSKVTIDNSFSWSPVDPITGGPLTEEVTIDADKDTLLRYKYYKNSLAPGDLVEITGGRKMKGAVKKIDRFYTYRINSKLSVDYIEFEDGTTVQRRYVKLINPERNNKNVSKS